MNKLIITILALSCMTANANEYDQRQTILLSEPQQAHVLQEMRKLLTGIQAILAAISTDDLEAVAEHARSLGMGMKKKPENQLKNELPLEFMQLGKSLHRSFDLIANDAETLKNPKHTLKQLSETMLQCQGCHEIYQIEAKSIENVVKIETNAASHGERMQGLVVPRRRRAKTSFRKNSDSPHRSRLFFIKANS